MAAHPDMTRMRTIPMAVEPNPSPAPFPNAAHPDISRVGRSRPEFDLRRWRFARLLHHDFGIRRRLLDVNRAVAIDHVAFHAAREKRQRGGD